MINLLPPNAKEALVWEKWQRLSILLGIIIFVFLLALTLVLFIGELRIQGEREAEKLLLEAGKRTFQVSGFEEIQQKAAEYQKTLLALAEFSAQGTDASRLTEVLARSLPPGVYLTLLSYNKHDGLVQLFGFAPKRADLFAFKQNLEEDSFFESVDFPPANWITSVDITFRATLKLASRKISNPTPKP